MTCEAVSPNTFWDCHTSPLGHGSQRRELKFNCLFPGVLDTNRTGQMHSLDTFVRPAPDNGSTERGKVSNTNRRVVWDHFRGETEGAAMGPRGTNSSWLLGRACAPVGTVAEQVASCVARSDLAIRSGAVYSGRRKPLCQSGW